MAETPAKLHVTKLSAAQRQLRAAIRLFFAGEDELAIHTIASAAYRILSDLKADRGRDEAADSYLTSIFYCIRSYRRGTLPSYLADDPATMEWIREMAEHLPIEASTRFEDVVASISPETAKLFWNKRNKISNFLKHADRDVRSSITLEEVDNLHLMMGALAAYVDLVPSDLGDEGLVFWLYFSVVCGISEGLPEEYQPIAARIEDLPPADRLVLCSQLIQELSEVS